MEKNPFNELYSGLDNDFPGNHLYTKFEPIMDVNDIPQEWMIAKGYYKRGINEDTNTNKD